MFRHNIYNIQTYHKQNQVHITYHKYTRLSNTFWTQDDTDCRKWKNPPTRNTSSSHGTSASQPRWHSWPSKLRTINTLCTVRPTFRWRILNSETENGSLSSGTPCSWGHWILSYSVLPKLAEYMAILEWGLHDIWSTSFSHTALLRNSSEEKWMVMLYFRVWWVLFYSLWFANWEIYFW